MNIFVLTSNKSIVNCYFKIKQWEDKDPEDRSRNFIPKKYDCLRKVPAYSNYIQERFERCLDLYLCPRQRRIRVSRAILKEFRGMSSDKKCIFTMTFLQKDGSLYCMESLIILYDTNNAS